MYQLKPECIPLLLKLANPISRKALLAQVASDTGADAGQLAAIFDAIESAGLLRQHTASAQSSSYQYGYGRGVLSHRAMLQDHVRTDGFRRALREVVRPGDVVIDVGSGSGILGFFAAEAGAGRVILVENTPVIEDAKQLAKDNGLEQGLEFHRVDAGAFDLDVKADVIVSEWIGFFLMEEYMYGAFTAVRDRCLAEGGTVVPRSARLSLAPIEDSRLYFSAGFGFWEGPVHGFEFGLGKARMLKRPRRQLVKVEQESLIAAPWTVLSIDCLRDRMDSFHFQQSTQFLITRGGALHGFAGWFDLDLSPQVRLDTSPFARQTHWQQVYFATPQVPVQAGDCLATTVTSAPGGVGPDITISATVLRGGTPVHAFEHLYHGTPW